MTRLHTPRPLFSILKAPVLCLAGAATFAIAPPAWPQSDGHRQSALMSRAELEAEQKVALSADKIIEMLRQETGLLLQVKKKLVREAFAQGRILDPSDLTDDALFRLLRDDENIRVLATREIENRYYVRAKPTKQEIEQQQVLAAQLGLSRAGSALAATGAPTARPAGVSQEDAYWAQQARGYEGASRGGTGQAPSQSISPPSAQPVRPENRLPDNPARQTNRTSLEGQDEFEDMDSGDLPRISPDQLSALLSTGSTSAPGSGTTPGASGIVPLSLISGMDPGMNGPGAKNLGSIGSLPVPLTSPDESTGPASLQTSQRAKLEGTRRPRTPSVTDLDLDRPQIRHRPNPYADVPSLYDLYAQVARQPAIIDRFGAAVFRNNGGNLDDLPMDLPAGPDYVLGPGDGLTIEMWGGIAQRMRRVVDREGRIALPEVGTVQVSGRTLGDVQHMVQSVLRTQFRDVEADVSLGRIRTVRVYVVGEVANPGAYDISSLSTHLNALYAAGGPTSRGSLRHLRHMRGNQLIQEVDTYDLLLRGTHSELARIQSGDTILVPPVGTEVVVEGMVRRPAIYELDQEKNLAEALELAGGVLPSGTLRHVDVERMVAHEKRTMLRLDLPETNDVQAVNKALEEFQVQDGDQIRISPILPYSDKTVYLDGHVFRPGKYPYRDGMKVTDVIRSYSELLPEPSARHAEIIRLQPPDYTPQVFAFNLAAAMEGKEQNVALKPFDTIRIFGRYDFEDQPLVTVTGEVRQPGDHVTNGVTHLRDAVHLADRKSVV